MSPGYFHQGSFQNESKGLQVVKGLWVCKYNIESVGRKNAPIGTFFGYVIGGYVPQPPYNF